MTKAELIAMVAEATKSKKSDVERIVNSLGDVAAAELLGGGEVSLPSLGKLKAHSCKARTGRNPRTGKPIEIPAKTAVRFTVGQALKNALKG